MGHRIAVFGSGRGWTIGATAVLLATAHLSAIYVTPEVREVPVSRLVANLERQLEKDPKNADIHINLARLHGMAYALKTEEVPTGGGRPADRDKPWYGYEPNLIPYVPQPAPSPESAKRAEAHLAEAIEHYRQALDLEPGNPLARLGYGWMLDQAGRKAEAIAEYRRVIEQTWPKEQKASMADLGERFYTEEAAGYLIPLLDPERDAAEIAELRARQAKLRAVVRPITPIIIPMIDTDAPDRLFAHSAPVRFDADGSGRMTMWSWITPDAGWLVYDRSGGGRITSALQWFGNVTFWLFWSNGYEAVAALDDDADGELAGAELEHLAIWRDGNLNGRSEPGEVRPLADHGIVSLSCRFVQGDGIALAALSPRGVRLADGRTRNSYDVILRPVRADILTRRD